MKYNTNELFGHKLFVNSLFSLLPYKLQTDTIGCLVPVCYYSSSCLPPPYRLRIYSSN